MILAPSELSTYAKKCTTGETESARGIREAEMFDIIPAIGAALYKAIESDQSQYDELLEGGVTYENAGCSGGLSMLHGLKTAIAYFAESRIATGNNVQLDRFGASIKQNEYGTAADAERYEAESTYLRTCGDKALDTVIGYLKAHETDAIYAQYVQKPNAGERADMVDINFINPN